MKLIGSNAFYCQIILRIVFLLHQTIHNLQNDPWSAKMICDPQKSSAICNIIIISTYQLWALKLNLNNLIRIASDHTENGSDCGSRVIAEKMIRITDHGWENDSDRRSVLRSKSDLWIIFLRIMPTPVYNLNEKCSSYHYQYFYLQRVRVTEEVGQICSS